MSTADFPEAAINGSRPDRIYTEAGTEFDNGSVNAYLKEVLHVHGEAAHLECEGPSLHSL